MNVRLLVVFLLACTRASNEAPAPREPGTVTLTDAQLASAQIACQKVQAIEQAPRLTALATIAGDSRNIARLGARVSGRVSAVDVGLGETVRKGQALIEIDTIELHKVLLEYQMARARTSAATDALARQQKLSDARVGAALDLKRAETESIQASAERNEAEEHLRNLGLVPEPGGALPERSILRAPIAGQVAALDVAIGQVLTGAEPIVTIVRADALWAVLRVYERDLARVRVGQPVDVRVPGADKIYAATITAVSELVDSVTRTAEARAAIATLDNGLRAGMSALASIAVDHIAGQRWLPAGAVERREKQRIVFVCRDGHHFAAFPVSVVAEQGDLVAVAASSLDGETEIVTRGGFDLRGELDRGVGLAAPPSGGD